MLSILSPVRGDILPQHARKWDAPSVEPQTRFLLTKQKIIIKFNLPTLPKFQCGDIEFSVREQIAERRHFSENRHRMKVDASLIHSKVYRRLW
jgi:hypothetical protein